MKSSEKVSISFETEGDLLEDIKASFSQIQELTEQYPSCKRYLAGINDMFSFFQTTYEKNVKLLEKCQELNTSIVINASKIQMIMNSTHSTADSIANLKAEYDEAAKIVQFVHTSETKSKIILSNLRKSLQILTEQVRKGEAFSFGENQSLFEVSQDVKNLRKETSDSAFLLQSLTNQYENLVLSVSTIRKDYELLNEEYKRISKAYELSLNQHNELEKQNDDTGSTVISIKPQVKAQQEQISQLSKQKAELTNQMNHRRNSQNDNILSLNSIREENRIRNEKNTKRQNHLNGLKKSGIARIARIDQIKDQIALALNQKNDLLKESDMIKQQLNSLQQEYDADLAKGKELATVKQSLRKEIKDLRTRITEAIFEESNQENEMHMVSRQITSEISDLNDLKSTELKAKHSLSEEKGNISSIKEETFSTKGNIQQFKDKITSLFHEIDEKRSLVFKIGANSQICLDVNKINNEENIKLEAELSNLQKKVQQQIQLTNQVRDERKEFKTEIRAKEAMIEDLQRANNDLKIEIEKCTKKNNKRIKSTVNSHFQCRLVNDEIATLKENIQMCQSGILASERAISRLLADIQTLNFIISESQNDSMHQMKERNLLEKSIEMLKDQIHEKELNTSSLRYDIQTELASLKNSSEMFNTKKTEINKLISTIESLKTHSESLSSSLKSMKQSESLMQKAYGEIIVEKHKYTTLLHEFAVPRNVHRWRLIEAVDPGYVKNIKFRSVLLGKLDQVHCKIIELQEQKAEIQKSIEQIVNAKVSDEISKAQVEHHISVYQSNIGKIEEQIRYIEDQIREQYAPLHDIQNEKGILKLKLTSTRGSVSSLKSEAFEKRKRSQSNLMFITEVSAPISFGGGFSFPKAQPTRNSENTLVGITPTPVLSRVPTKGLLVGRNRVSPTFNERNGILPSIE